jgi:hypothetical protein
MELDDLDGRFYPWWQITLAYWRAGGRAGGDWDGAYVVGNAAAERPT